MFQKQKINFRAFTLVELIVVITIVGILSTVGFVSYSGYLTGARDSNRISQMVKLSDSLQVYATSKSLPLPDNYLEISQSGSITSYQGIVGADVLETIDYTNGGLDPKDDSYYSYAITKDRKKIQLLAFMEKQSTTSLSNISSTYAVDYTERFATVYGSKIGILVRSSDNMPIDQIPGGPWANELETINDEMTAYFSNDLIVTGTGAKVSRAKRYHAADFSEPYSLENSNLHSICVNHIGEYFVINLSSDPSYIIPEKYITKSEFSKRLFVSCIETDKGVSHRFISQEGDFYTVDQIDT